jgi:hypothetical protein
MEIRVLYFIGKCDSQKDMKDMEGAGINSYFKPIRNLFFKKNGW